MEITQKIKYEAERSPGFSEEIRGVTGCEQLQHCIQCGTCSGVCPMSLYMDRSPRQLMALVRSDFKQAALSSYAIWLCAECYACTTECPREIRITDILYELKQRAIQERVYPKKFTIPVLAQEFYKMTRTQGRVTENFLAAFTFLKTNWKMMFGMWRLGLGLMKQGRFPLKLESIKRKEELGRMMKTVDNLTINALPKKKEISAKMHGGGH